MAVPVTEDTPPDLLAGSMDLTVLLPDGRATKTSVQRATAMMDLLVQLCTSHRLSPGGHSLQPLGEKGALPYKPSTPIGLLDAWSVRLLPKGATHGATPTIQEHPHQLPFQHTFRLQVHLPRNQLLVSRVTPQMGLAAVLKMACEEKNLDPGKYELRHPINLEERLRPELTLGDYGLTEVCVMSRDASTADALALQREQERRRRRARHQHGHVAPPPPPVGRQPAAEGSAVTGSVSSGSLGGRSSSPDSTPAAPPPRAPARKRRPAPPPPSSNTDAKTKACDKREPAVVITEAGSEQVVSHRDGTAPTVTHSRTSSDSSGYHEASVLSDGPDTHPGDKTISTREMPPPTTNSTLPRRSKLPPATGTTLAAQPKRLGPTVAKSMPLSRSVSNLASAAPGRAVHGEHSTSTSSLSSTGRGPRKKKAAPPPPPVAVAPARAPGGAPDAPAPHPAEPRPSDAPAESRALPRPVAPAGNSDARRAASIEEEKEAPDPERRPSREAVAKHHQQQQRSSAELPAEKADLYAKLQRRLPSRGDSLTSTSSSGSDDAAAPTADGKRASVPAPAVRPSRSRDRASTTPGDGQPRPQPDVVAVQAAPPGSVSSKHSSTAPDEDDLAVDEGIGNDDAAEEVARAFASAAAELEAAILAEDLAAAAAENPTTDYCSIDPPCPTSLRAADVPPQLPPSPSPDAPVGASDGEDWHYELPAPPSAFRDSAESPPPTPWSYAGGEVRSKANPLYESGEFVAADSSSAKEVSDGSGEPPAVTEERNTDRTSAEEEGEDVQRAPTAAERQLQGVLDAKARLLLPQPPPLIQGPVASDAAVKDADNEPVEGSPSDVPDMADDSSVSQENHSHSLLNHHHAGLLHRHAATEHHHDHHHLSHHDHHHHDGHSANVGMPAYLTETIDTLEGFEDLIAVGSGSRPPEECQGVESGSTGGAELQVAEGARRNSTDSERPVVVGEVVKSSESNVTQEMSPANAEVVKGEARNTTSASETPIESKENAVGSGEPAVKSGEVFPRRRPSGEVAVEERKEEAARAEADRQQRAQRRRTVEVSGPLVNFTITTYRREIDPDKIFSEGEDAGTSHIPAVTAPSTVAAVGSERRPSQVSRSNSVGGSSAGSSRRGSQAEPQPGRPHSQVVKRSVSNVYTVLQGMAAREEAHLSGAKESNHSEDSGSSQLQSLQVLRSILPQLESTAERQTPSSNSEGSDAPADTSAAVPQFDRSSRDPRKTTEEARVPEVVVKPQPYRPPAVSFASWGERPRGRAVSLKVDSDYRVGGAHTKAQQTSQEPQPANISKAATADGATSEKQSEMVTAVPPGQNVPVRSGEPSPQQPQPAPAKVEPTVIRISTAEPRIRAVQLKAHPPPSGVQSQPQRSDPVTARRDSAALTMRIISHTTAAPFVRQGTTSVTVNGDERVVPVVRAVELKKSALQQKRQAGDEEQEEQAFVGVSSLAKRFSFLGDNTVVQRRNSGSGGGRAARRPVSELVTASDAALASAEPGGPVLRAGSFASLVSASRASQLGRSDSSDDSGIGHSAGVLSQNGHTSPTAKQAPVTVSVSAAPKGFPLPVVKGFRVPGGGAPEPRKGITLVSRPKAGAAAASAQPAAPAQNPHEQLMAAIRGFGGTGNLRTQAQKFAECES